MARQLNFPSPAELSRAPRPRSAKFLARRRLVPCAPRVFARPSSRVPPPPSPRVVRLRVLQVLSSPACSRFDPPREVLICRYQLLRSLLCKFMCKCCACISLPGADSCSQTSSLLRRSTGLESRAREIQGSLLRRSSGPILHVRSSSSAISFFL